VQLKIARRLGGHRRSVRIGYCASFAALLFLFGSESLQNATANGDTRSISLRSTHTKETLTITYKVNGRYDEDALKKLNHILRDWREDQPIKMDPHLIDLIWDVYREVEATEPIAIVCGYRSPGTNAMLRRRSSGVAKFSQHMLGKAMDFYIPGVPLERLREAGLRASRGGVGFYPSSNFVHLDTGSVRHWPRMPEAQLARVMAKGPLTAVASRGQETKTASFKLPNPFAKLFGGGEEEEDAETVAATTPTRTAEAKKPAPRSTAKSTERPAVVAAAPSPPARPATAESAPQQPAGFDLASASSRPVELRPGRATSLVNGGSANDVISERGFWQSLPESQPARRPAAVASADSAATGSVTPWPTSKRENTGPATGPALAYAPTSHPAAPSRPAATAAARTAPAQKDTTVAVKRGTSQPTQASAAAPAAPPKMVKVGQRFNDPWMRAMIVAPSAGGFMSTSLFGASDYRVLSPYLHKPTTSVMMTFAHDPYLGMTTEKFAGTAVVFVSTVTFGQRTASLR
jgi:uncharacterized protein YcbK (DUF882 family)